MPMHDWTRVDAGIFHHLHSYWIGEIGRAVGPGKLPRGYSALVEQVVELVGRSVPDVLTLARDDADPLVPPPGGGGLAVRSAPPAARVHARTASLRTPRTRKRLTVRHVSTNRLVAVVEVMSAGNKSSAAEYRRFVRKSVELLRRGVNLVLVDPLPPSRRDPHGVHGRIWAEAAGESFALPPSRRLTVASYVVGAELEGFVDPFAVGEPVPDAALFLAPGLHVLLPLEATYQAAFATVPEPWSDTLAAPGP